MTLNHKESKIKGSLQHNLQEVEELEADGAGVEMEDSLSDEGQSVVEF